MSVPKQDAPGRRREDEEALMNSTIDGFDDRALAELARRDRQAAMTRVWTDHQGRLRRRARAIVHDEDLAFDAVQEVFVRAWNEPRFFDEGFRRGAWLYRVTTNLCFNRVRDRRRRQDILAARPPKEPAPPTQADAVLDAERGQVLAHAMGGLTEDHRTILTERYVHDRSYKEIAEVLGLKLGTVMSRLARARAALADHLPDHLVAEL